MSSILTFSNRSVKLFTLKNRFLITAKVLHSIRMCLTVQVVWQVKHCGCGSCFKMHVSLYTFHLLLLSQQVSIAMWTILISKSWWWLLKLKRSTSTFHHNKFPYLDYVFLLSSIIYIYVYMFDNFDKFIHQFQPETKTLFRKLKRIWI